MKQLSLCVAASVLMPGPIEVVDPAIEAQFMTRLLTDSKNHHSFERVSTDCLESTLEARTTPSAEAADTPSL